MLCPVEFEMRQHDGSAMSLARLAAACALTGAFFAFTPAQATVVDKSVMSWLKLKPAMAFSEATNSFPQLKPVPCKAEDKAAIERQGWACEMWRLDGLTLGGRVFRGQVRQTLDGTRIGMVRLYASIPGTARDVNATMRGLEWCDDTLQALEGLYGQGDKLRKIMAPGRVNYAVQYQKKDGLVGHLLICSQGTKPDEMHITVTATAQ